jgi:predicted DNA-binding transcriptional regulator AlpA
MSEVLIPTAGLKAKGIQYHPDHIRRLVKQGRFPKPVKLNGPLSPNAWVESEIDAYVRERIEARNAASEHDA